MRHDFGIFIPSHGRVDKQLTLRALQRSGYTGNWHIICDDEDEQLPLYKDKYGDNKIIVFHKQDIAEKIDTMMVNPELRSSLYAYNFAYEAAASLGYKIFGIMDDDQLDFRHVYVDNGKMQSHVINELDKVIDAVIDYMNSVPISCISFARNAALYGADAFENMRMRHNMCQAFFVKTSDPLPFIGVMNHDLNAWMLGSMRGQLIYEIKDVVVDSPKCGTNSGGLAETYTDFSMYSVAFYNVIAAPACIKITDKYRSMLTIAHERIAPKLISERWKK